MYIKESQYKLTPGSLSPRHIGFLRVATEEERDLGVISCLFQWLWQSAGGGDDSGLSRQGLNPAEVLLALDTGVKATAAFRARMEKPIPAKCCFHTEKSMAHSTQQATVSL